MRSPMPAEPVGAFRLNDATRAAWARTLECVRLLRATAVLLQCPASFRPSDENVERMRAFLGAVERPVRVLWEPRGPWPEDLVRSLCSELDLARLRGMLPQTGTAYVMFNNIPRVGDAERFRALL